MPASRAVARFNRRVTNRTIGRFADRLPGFAVVYHVGRNSGRTFHTPVNAFRDGSDYIIALTYGPDADWVKNVLATGACEIVTRGHRIALTNPRIVTDEHKSWAPPFVRQVLGLVDAPQYLRLTRAERASG